MGRDGIGRTREMKADVFRVIVKSVLSGRDVPKISGATRQAAESTRNVMAVRCTSHRGNYMRSFQDEPPSHQPND